MCNRFVCHYQSDVIFINDSILFGVQDQLRNTIDYSDLVEKSTILESFAYATPERNRVFGSPGHKSTLNWIYESIKALGDYYDVEFQPFVELFADGNASLIINGVDQAASVFQYTPPGKLVEELVPVSNLGCNAVSLKEPSWTLWTKNQ